MAGLQANVDLVRPRELVSRWEPAPEEAMATDSVVYASVLFLISDYFITAYQLNFANMG